MRFSTKRRSKCCATTSADYPSSVEPTRVVSSAISAEAISWPAICASWKKSIFASAGFSGADRRNRIYSREAKARATHGRLPLEEFDLELKRRNGRQSNFLSGLQRSTKHRSLL